MIPADYTTDTHHSSEICRPRAGARAGRRLMSEIRGNAGNTRRKLRESIRAGALGMEGMERKGGGGLASPPQSFEGFQPVHCVPIREREGRPSVLQCFAVGLSALEPRRVPSASAPSRARLVLGHVSAPADRQSRLPTPPPPTHHHPSPHPFPPSLSFPGSVRLLLEVDTKPTEGGERNDGINEGGKKEREGEGRGGVFVICTCVQL